MGNLMEPALFNAQLTRTMGCTNAYGAEIGECLAIADKIIPGDNESWFQQWLNFADKNDMLGMAQRKKGLARDAKCAFLRASNYYRTAFFFLEDKPDDPRIESTLKKSVDAFHQALALFDWPVEQVSIPFSDLQLPGYLYLNRSPDNSPKGIIIDTGGGDATKEESYFGVASEALQHGMHCLSFEGPGQGGVLRLNKIPFIPDWERVIEKVVDFVLQRPEIDPKKIILIGRSFGGYLAARAVTKEKRIAACIVDPGIFDNYSNLEAKFSSLTADKFPDLKNEPLHKIMERAMQEDETTRFMFASRTWRFGAKTIEEMVNNIQSYSLQGLVESIACPMLVCDNTLEYITLGQAKKLYDQLKCPKKYVLFDAESGTGGHCEPLTPQLFSAAMYEWLSEIGLMK